MEISEWMIRAQGAGLRVELSQARGAELKIHTSDPFGAMMSACAVVRVSESGVVSLRLESVAGGKDVTADELDATLRTWGA